jgi:hypothetical protein
MDGDIILLTECHGHPALCEYGIALQGMAFSENDHSTYSAEIQGSAKPGDSAADDEKIRGGKGRQMIGRHRYFRPTPGA